MSIIQSIILGLVQGLSEFLPISSSGHLAVFQHFMGIREEDILTFTVMLHFGTLLSIFVAYWSDIVALVKELFLMIADICTGKGIQMNKNETRRLGVMIVIATIPAAVAGLLFEDFFNSLYSNMTFIGIGLLLTGTLLFSAEKWGGGDKDVEKMSMKSAFFVGICQALAMCPGISRSGMTMVGGLASKYNRAHAVRFAFLISIPTVLGAFLLELPDAMEAIGQSSEAQMGAGALVIGVAVAAVSGYAAIKVMIRAVTNKKLIIFSIYTWMAGAALIIYSLVA
ncbi:MAG: undecaprenyl-diphosphate phosphatase [Firmicutes bacterium]|nr:undecaprenyl-diphosphate phosphatase [Bacillota bacterium]